MSQLSTTIAKSKTNPQNLLTFHPPDKPNQYRAIGLVKGQFISEQGNPQRGILVTPDQVFPARLAPYLPNPPQTEVIWRVWVKTHFTEEGLSFYLKSCVRDEENHPISPQHLQQDYFSIRGQLQWWNLEEKQLGIRITPNSPQERSFKPFFLVIHGELSNPQKNSFWELSATREGKTLVLQEGQEIYPPKHKKKKATSATKVETVTTDELHGEIISAIGKELGKSTINRWLSQGKLQERLAHYCGHVPFEVEFAEKAGTKNLYHIKRTVKEKTSPSPAPQTNQQLPTKIMVKGRIPEITVKFNEKIDLPSEGKKVSIEVKGENDIIVRALINRKTLKKQVAKMDEFENWVGALSGKITQILPNGVIELEQAGIQIFEKKNKEA